MSLPRIRIAPSAGHPDHIYDRANRAAADGDLERAEALYRQLLGIRPGHAEGHNNLGNVLLAQGRCDDALAAFEMALGIGLDHPSVHYNRASALKEAGRYDEAVRAFHRCLVRAPDYVMAYNNLANLHSGFGRWDSAVAGYRRSITLAPGWTRAQDNLRATLQAMRAVGEGEAALRHALLWRRDHPDQPLARHTAAALAGEAGDPRASDTYVKQLFDAFAGEFDTKLAAIGYRAPALLAEAVAAVVAPSAGLDVLDAGCGTGLCGPHLRPYARSLTGVDLSAGMLDKAAARGLYDRLEEAELEAFARAHPGGFDLIVSADVLCYFGALDAILPAFAAALRPGGRLAFTVERLAGGSAGGWALMPHGRYAHEEPYVRATLEASGFTAVTVGHGALRRECGEDVTGLVVMAVRA
ncbi:tetratricopeptide repeat protein [Azospirillum sp. RWY-5-1]|uniref:Tetratricopeptide repeat protein n=1 Tax=Azospirillum oleiclasticum TaxID=2735135 RepID=A0ABX2TDS3_9PROT|nr:tetratricopeptide repeat protein [Azospirillum oleiclasticum]NYZ15443.1 tetratricopeptide repeat protein [Azospirillum oleiclasticum]NYZ22466.1 tetratricopeptide repeat protein [Azospirillum oleiclasticum]